MGMKGPVATDNRPHDWMDWMDSCGVEFFGCDENCAAASGRLGETWRLPGNGPSPSDYAALHDELLEALLYEQTMAKTEASETPTPISNPGSEDEQEPKRRRLFPQRNAKQAASPGPARALALNLTQFSRVSYPDAATYLHPHCRMQKDKGKGEEVGSHICAKGRDACLEKFREKMRVLTEVAMGDKPATMKRRKARVMKNYENFCETRSLIELRMGFLSMQYGILLRWDVNAKVTLIVLRKMCHDKFYPSLNQGNRIVKTRSHMDDSISCSSDMVGSDNAILHRSNGTEVTLLSPPYRVTRPEKFDPTTLHISVACAVGLSRKSNWTVQIVYGENTEDINMVWNSKLKCTVPKIGEPITHEINDTSSLGVSGIEVHLFEQKPLSRKHQQRLVSSMEIPLRSLEPQGSDQVKPIRVTIPCRHDQDASIALDLSLISDYSAWLKKELDARRREEQQSMWSESVEEKYFDENEEEPWYWICSIC